MTSFKPKLWTTLSAAALISVGALGGCKPGEEAPAAAIGEGGEGGAEGGSGSDATAQAVYTSVPAESRVALRLAHLKGFFLVALAQTEGEDAAATLAGRGMLKVYDAQPGAFDASGLDKATLNKAAASGARADLEAAVRAIDAASAKAGGDPAVVAGAMAAMASGLYTGVVMSDSVDRAEYQHSYGAVLSAKAIVDGLDKPEAKLEIQRLVDLFPSPQPPATPSPVAQVAAQVSRVQLALN